MKQATTTSTPPPAHPGFDLFVPPPSALRVCGSGASMFVWSPKNGVFVSVSEGRVTAEMAELIVREASRRIREQKTPIDFFHHWQKVTAYDPAVRPILVDWGLNYHRDCGGFHFLSGTNKVLKMGVALAALVVPKVYSYSSETMFEQAYCQSLRASTKR